MAAEQADDHWLFEEQLRRWKAEPLTTAQRQEIERLTSELAVLRQLTTSIRHRQPHALGAARRAQGVLALWAPELRAIPGGGRRGAGAGRIRVPRPDLSADELRGLLEACARAPEQVSVPCRSPRPPSH
jgi:hypothetical protein